MLEGIGEIEFLLRKTLYRLEEKSCMIRDGVEFILNCRKREREIVTGVSVMMKTVC